MALSRRHPAAVLATWFGAGLLPRAPGTWGSAAALPLAWLLVAWGGPTALALAVVVVSAVGWWASAVYVTRTGRDDPGEIVIDEVAGQWLALIFVPLDPLLYLAAFAAFRLFDIKKPFPVGWLDRHIDGGLGVMADDIAAGLYAMAIMQIALLVR
jgi:phosphatidylglycerophosphatase A